MSWDKERFKRHLEARYEPPDAKFPPVFHWAAERWRTLLRGVPTWKTAEAGALRARRYLHFHVDKEPNKDGRPRKVRSQRLHTDEQIGLCLLLHTNLQPKHRSLTPYQIVSLSVATIMRKTGFSKSTVLDALGRFEALGLLRTKRQRTETPEGLREITAVRWLTKTYFAALGLLRELAEQLDPSSPSKARRSIRLAMQRKPPSTTSPEPDPSPPKPLGSRDLARATFDLLKRTALK